VSTKLYFLGTETPECETDHSRTFSTEIQNAWSFASISLAHFYVVLLKRRSALAFAFNNNNNNNNNNKNNHAGISFLRS
jgi:hypothetical protein